MCRFYLYINISNVVELFFVAKNHTLPPTHRVAQFHKQSADIIAVIGNNIRRCNPRYFLYSTTQQSLIWQATAS